MSDQTPTEVLRVVASEFYEKADHAQEGARTPDEERAEAGLGHLEDMSEGELDARKDAYQEAANRCRELANELEGSE